MSKDKTLINVISTALKHIRDRNLDNISSFYS